jgi:hypothetical protein
MLRRRRGALFLWIHVRQLWTSWQLFNLVGWIIRDVGRRHLGRSRPTDQG